MRSFFHLSPQDGSERRSSSISAVLQQMRRPKSRKQKKSALSAYETRYSEEHSAYDFLASNAPGETRKRTFAGFFRGWGSSKMSNKARYKASRVMKPPSPKDKSQIKSFDIDMALVDRVMGAPKNAKQASENFLVQQRIRARSRSRTRGAHSTDEPRGDGQRGHTKPLTTPEAQQMFVGAPYFNVGKVKNGYRPQVVFVDAKSRVYNPCLVDHKTFTHPSFEASTLATEAAKKDVKSVLTNSRTALLEMPNMLASTGLETGTTSFEHFLQLAVSDSVKALPELFMFANRRLLYTDPEQLGFRELNIETQIGRLTELGAVQCDDDATLRTTNDSKIRQMGDELFKKLLSPTITSRETTTLRGQIEALQTALCMKELWHDFSVPDVRLRIGQLLWTAAPDTPGRPSHADEVLEPTERDMVLLQITLASELRVRLAIVRALSANRGRGPLYFSEGDRVAVESQRTAKVNWDLLLAERFLDNVEVSSCMPNQASSNGVISKISHPTSKDTSEPFYQLKNQAQQISGLLHFAESIQWPDSAELEKELVSKLLRSVNKQAEGVTHDDNEDVCMSPMKCPCIGFPGETEYSTQNEKSKKFLGVGRLSRPGTAKSEQSAHAGSLKRADTAHSMRLYRSLATTADGDGKIHVGGWLSRSWLSGLVLPGEVSSHFLMSTILENTPHALDSLGDMANLQSGFVYKDRSYWSKRSIIGRVMAAAKGARECMGWISVPGVPLGSKEGWIKLETRDGPHCGASTSRIKDSEAIGKESDPMGNADLMVLQATDFSSPHDSPPVMGNEVRSHGLALIESESAGESQLASVTFSSPINSKLSTIHVSLSYDVQFVSSYPCHPEERKAKAKTKSKPKPKPAPEPDWGDLMPSDFVAEAQLSEPEDEDDIEPVDPPKDSARCSDYSKTGYIMAEEAMRSIEPPPCHALHKDYRFESIPVATLLSVPPEQRPCVLSEVNARSNFSQDESRDIAVLDCRGTEDLQLLARAWCAHVGENAIVARVGRTCLACSIREAEALAMNVVIRI